MTCPDWESLCATVDGEEIPEKMAAVAAHARGCPACRSALASLSAAKRALASLPAEPMPEDLRDALEGMARGGGGPLLGAFVPALGLSFAAAAVAVCLWGAWLRGRPPAKVPVEPPMSSRGRRSLDMPPRDPEAGLAEAFPEGEASGLRPPRPEGPRAFRSPPRVRPSAGDAPAGKASGASGASRLSFARDGRLLERSDGEDFALPGTLPAEDARRAADSVEEEGR